jgi:predicted site-specific integrase-resolvase
VIKDLGSGMNYRKPGLNQLLEIHKGEQPSFEEDLAKDVLEIITVFRRVTAAAARKTRS